MKYLFFLPLFILALFVAGAVDAQTSSQTPNIFYCLGHSTDPHCVSGASQKSVTGTGASVGSSAVPGSVSGVTGSHATSTATGPILLSNISLRENNGTGDYCLDDFQNGTKNGTKIILFNCNYSDPAQKFINNNNTHVGTAADNTIQIHGKCLDVTGNSVKNGAKIQLWTCNGGKNQQWIPKQITSGTGQAQGEWEIVGVQSGKCLDDTQYGLGRTQQEIWPCSGNDNQSWNWYSGTLGNKLACKNLNWSGYSYTVPSSAKSVFIGGNWKVSPARCKKGNYGFSQWPGITGGGSGGGWVALLGSFSLCNGTSAQYFSWSQAFPGPFQDVPSKDKTASGDNMSGSVSMTKPGTFQTILSDKTKGWTFTRTMTFKSNQQVVQFAEMILEDAGLASKPFRSMPVFNDAYFSNNVYSVNSATHNSLLKAPGLACFRTENTNTKAITDVTSPMRANNFYVTFTSSQ